MAKPRAGRPPPGALLALAGGLAGAWWLSGATPEPARPGMDRPVGGNPPAAAAVLRVGDPTMRPPPADFSGAYNRATGAVSRGEGLGHYALGVELLDRGDYYTAASHLVMARDGLGDTARVCEMLAIAYDRLNMTRDLLGIMPCLDAAARDHESAALLYDRLEKQLDVEQEFLAAASDHFVASYPATASSAAAIGSVLDLLERARGRVEDELGIGSIRLVPVVVYEGDQFAAATDKPHWASGLYDGKIRMSLETWRERPQFFETALAHEYVHALTHEYTGTRLPSWFREGIADALARNGSEQARNFAAGGATNRILEIDELSASFMELPEDLARAAYLQSHAMVLGLVHESGWGAVQALILDLHRDRTLEFDTAFYDLFGENPADYLDRWYSNARR